MDLFSNGAITLSFDDGWKCIYDNAFPIIKKNKILATFYVISGYLDDEQFPRYMNIEDIRDLEKHGHEIGCHTVSHKHLSQENKNIIKEEIISSLDYLKNEGFSVSTFSYPYGEFNDEILEIVKNAGFIGARSVERGFNDLETNPFLLKCQAVKTSTKPEQVKEWIDFAKARNKWLILMLHQIDHDGREWSTTSEILTEIVDCIKNSNINSITLKEGLKILNDAATI